MTAAQKETLVLVADDEPSTLALVASHVRSKGFNVLEASDGDLAWQLAHEHLPDLIILDVMMPGMSGWEVCRKVREAVSLAHTGVIMLTGIGENLNEMTSPLYGADSYIDKPFEFTDLDEKIEEVLERRRKGALGRSETTEDALLSESEEPAPKRSRKRAAAGNGQAEQPKKKRRSAAAPVLTNGAARGSSAMVKATKAARRPGVKKGLARTTMPSPTASASAKGTSSKSKRQPKGKATSKTAVAKRAAAKASGKGAARSSARKAVKKVAKAASAVKTAAKKAAPRAAKKAAPRAAAKRTKPAQKKARRAPTRAKAAAKTQRSQAKRAR